MRATEVERLDVYCDGNLAGLLERTATGNRFTYSPAYLEAVDKPPQGIAFHLPYRKAPFEQAGDNLPPFFANLLPEGLRLTALISRARTSASDMFSLLVEAGPDVIGDVYALPAGEQVAPTSSLQIGSLSTTSFDEVLKRVLQGGADATIPGVQDKLSVSDATIALPVTGRTLGAAILKLSPMQYPRVVENEACFLAIAKRCGFKVNEAKVVKDREGRTGLLVSRFDRVWQPERVRRLHQEDGCQFMNRYPADKYRLHLRQIAEGLVEYCDAPLPQLLELLRRHAFAYMIGNADLHAKNVSLMRSPVTGLIEQTPLYDVVCTLAYPQLESRMVMQIDGKDNRLRMHDFVTFGQRFGLREQAVAPAITAVATKLLRNLDLVDSLPYPPETTTRMRATIEYRVKQLH